MALSQGAATWVMVSPTFIEEFHLVALSDDAVGNLEVGDDAAERVEHRVEDQRLQRSLLVAHGVRYALDDGIQDILYALARLSRCTQNVLRVAAYQVYYLVLHLVRHGAGHVNLVDDGNDFQVVVDGQIEVRDGLCLYALRGVDHQQRTLAGGYRTADFIREVHVSRSVNQIEYVFLSLVHIFHLDGVALDGDAALALQVHVVQHLSFGHLYGLGELQQTVGQGRFSVVYMCNDTKISYMIH